MMVVASILLVFSFFELLDAAHEAFDVRQHLSTVSRFLSSLPHASRFSRDLKLTIYLH